MQNSGPICASVNMDDLVNKVHEIDQTALWRMCCTCGLVELHGLPLDPEILASFIGQRVTSVSRHSENLKMHNSMLMENALWCPF